MNHVDARSLLSRFLSFRLFPSHTFMLLCFTSFYLSASAWRASPLPFRTVSGKLLGAGAARNRFLHDFYLLTLIFLLSALVMCSVFKAISSSTFLNRSL